MGEQSKRPRENPLFSVRRGDGAWMLRTETPAARRESELPGNARKALSEAEYVEKQRGGEGGGWNGCGDA